MVLLFSIFDTYMKQIAFAAIVLLAFSRCSHSTSDLNKVWFFNEAEFPEAKNDLPVEDPKASYLNFSAQSFLDLQENGTYTSNFGRFEQGKWALKNKTLVLFNQDHKLQFEVQHLRNDEMKLYYKPRNTVYLFSGFANAFASEEDNPFSAANNRWRMKAGQPETDADISQRLLSHFRFQEKYFAWGSASDIKVLDVNATPGPLKIYSNGFELLHLSKQPHQWTNAFFDTSGSRRAYDKLYYLFQNDDIDWIKTKDRFRMFASAFKQLQQKIEAGNSNASAGAASQ